MGFDEYMESLEKLSLFMQKNGIASFKGVVDEKPVEIVFVAKPVASESRPVVESASVVPLEKVFADVDGAGVCACGHSWIEHTEAGCLHGCSHELCTANLNTPLEP